MINIIRTQRTKISIYILVPWIDSSQVNDDVYFALSLFLFIPPQLDHVPFFINRCFLGPNTGPAQWPNCNRYVEAVISKLCQVFPSSRRNEEGIKVDRWTLIGRAYEHIRQCVLHNAHVMANTSLQLPSINKTTLTQW